MYEMVSSKLNLTHVVSVVSKFMANRHGHCEALRYNLRYVHYKKAKITDKKLPMKFYLSIKCHC